VGEAVVSMVVSGNVVSAVSHRKENPAIPLMLPSSPDHCISMVSSLLQLLTVCDVLNRELGLEGALVSM